MKYLFALLLTITSAFAQDQCMPTERAVSIIESRGWDNIVVRDEAMGIWVQLVAAFGIEVDPDFVVIVFTSDRAVILFGKGDEVCQPFHMPLAVAKSILRPA